jgi:hypothetical protein
MTDKRTEAERPLKISEDKSYGKYRQQIMNEWIGAGRPMPEKNWLYSRLVENRAREEELVTALEDLIEATRFGKGSGLGVVDARDRAEAVLRERGRL